MDILRFYREYRTRKIKEKHFLIDFYKDLEAFNLIATELQQAKVENLYPCLFDKTAFTEIEPIYFLQDAWAFEKIFRNNPISHVDVGSHHKFVAFLS